MRFRNRIYTTVLTIGLVIWLNPATAKQLGTVRVSDLRMRSGPGVHHRVVRFLPKGTRVSVLTSQKGWLEIEHNDTKGYILKKKEFINITNVPSTFQNNENRPLKNSKIEAETINKRLRKAQSALAAVTFEEKKIMDAFNAADIALNNARQHVSVTNAGLAKVLKNIDKVYKRTAVLEKKILDGERYAAKRLVALYKLDWVGKIHLLATADSFFDFISRKQALERILSRDEAHIATLNRDKATLETLLTQLNTRKAEKRALEQTLRERVKKLSKQQKKRKQLLKTIRSKKSLERAGVESLHQAALELDATIKRIEPIQKKESFFKAFPKKDKSFADYKGLLRWPVKGKIISFFGPYRDKKFAITNFHSGINIQAERGEPIRSVLSGHVIFSNWLKGFGNMMIVDHGNHYYTVYAHLEEVFKIKGDRVDQDEVIATVGDSGSMSGPALHFEVRHHGKPVDPLNWIQKQKG